MCWKKVTLNGAEKLRERQSGEAEMGNREARGLFFKLVYHVCNFKSQIALLIIKNICLCPIVPGLNSWCPKAVTTNPLAVSSILYFVIPAFLKKYSQYCFLILLN